MKDSIAGRRHEYLASSFGLSEHERARMGDRRVAGFVDSIERRVPGLDAHLTIEDGALVEAWPKTWRNREK